MRLCSFQINTSSVKLTAEFKSSHNDIPTLKNLLERAESALESDLVHKNILAKALLVELFAFLNNPNLLVSESESLNDNMGEVKKYIDINYAFLNNITQIADKFYYSREHLSRKFKDRFNISVSEYLSRRRVTESIKLLPQMSISEICYTVGFKSQSVYISSFKKNMGCLPSEYKNYLLKYSKLQ